MTELPNCVSNNTISNYYCCRYIIHYYVCIRRIYRKGTSHTIRFYVFKFYSTDNGIVIDIAGYAVL